MNPDKSWNADQARIPETKIQSQYAEQKEMLFPRNSMVADIGGGSGSDANYFLTRGHKVTLVDISDLALQKAKEKAQQTGLDTKLQTIQIDLGAGELAIPDSSVDVVYSRLALHFFNREETVNILKKIRAILKPGGKAYFSIKSPEDTQEMEFLNRTAKQVEAGVFDDQGRMKSRFTIEQWQDILKEADIENAQVRSYIENLFGRGDVTQSGTSELLLIEIEFSKE